MSGSYIFTCTTGLKIQCTSEEADAAAKKPNFFTTESLVDKDIDGSPATTLIFDTMTDLFLSKIKIKIIKPKKKEFYLKKIKRINEYFKKKK